jgi:hypothetical protein
MSKSISRKMARKGIKAKRPASKRYRFPGQQNSRWDNNHCQRDFHCNKSPFRISGVDIRERERAEEIKQAIEQANIRALKQQQQQAAVV